MKNILLLPLVLLLISMPLQAEQAPIDEMFSVMMMDQQMEGGFEAMLPMVDNIAARAQLNDQAKDELRKAFRSWFEQDIDRDKIKEQIKGLYAENFNDDEIKKIIAFYKTDIGQKLLIKQQELMQEGAKFGMQEAQRKQDKLMQRVQPILEKYGAK